MPQLTALRRDLRKEGEEGEEKEEKEVEREEESLRKYEKLL